MTHVEARWPTMGCEAAVWLTADRPAAELDALVARIRATVDDVAQRLTRFSPDSELMRLNADPRALVPASRTVRRFVLAARRAGVLTGGLVDATRLEDVVAAGYVGSRATADGARPAPWHREGAIAATPGLEDALAAAPARRPAGPHAARAYLTLEVGLAGIHRPPGVRLDAGGIGKGLAADLAAAHVPHDVTYAISIGGDLALGGAATQPLDVLDARTGDVAHRLQARPGGVATSGIHARMWAGPGGAAAHHLIDPATGEPAWTGLVSVTAAGTDAVEAEALAKAALLSGPLGARRWLRRRGGVLQHDDGRMEVVEAAPVVRLAA